MRNTILTLLVVLAANDVASGAGGEICTRTDGLADGYYYGLSGTGADRFITEFDVLTDPCFDPLAVICGVRVRELYRGVPRIRSRGVVSRCFAESADLVSRRLARKSEPFLGSR